MVQFNYKPDGQTIIDFMKSPAFVRGLRGPVGSGKSVSCVAEMFRLALEQERCFDPKTVREVPGGGFTGERTGKKRVRSGVIRNTSPQLETTTMKTWLEWLPEHEFGPMRWRPPFRQQIEIPEIGLEWEVWFLALDKPDDVKKLLSFEFTNIWINEAREVPREVVTAAISRVKRFPRMIDGGATRACVIMDTNAPDEDHWWSIMAGDSEPPDWMNEEDRLTLVKPEDWEFFVQPPAMLDRLNSDGTLAGYELNPARENARFTDQTYYTGLIHGQSRDWIKNMVQNQIGRIFSGRPVYQGFNERLHLAVGGLEVDPNEPLYVGVDFGLTPAAAFCQDVRGQARTIDELVTKDMHTEQFAILLRNHLNEHYAGHRRVVLIGDPRGDDRQPNQIDAKMTAFRIFKKHGLDIRPAHSNDPLVRQGAVQTQMNTLVDGRPGYVLSDKCTYLVAAKRGGYCFLKDTDMVDKKSIYSHVSDGEQYAFLGMGFGKQLVGAGAPSKPVQAAYKQNLWNRHGGSTPRRRNMATVLSRGLGKR